METYPILTKYARSFAARGVEQSTVAQCIEKLTRVLNVLANDFNVVVQDDAILGLDGRVLTDYYAWLSDGRKISTRNNYVSFINPFLLWLYETERMERDLSKVLTTYKLPSQDKIPEWERKNPYLTQEQVMELMENTPGRNKVRDQAIIALFLGSGLRVSELCMLSIGSIVDAPRGDVYVRRKGGVWCHTEVADYVYPYLERYLATRSDCQDHSQPLFITTHGNPCNRNQIYKALSFKQKALGVATGPHSLRHTFISEAEKRGGAGVARDLANHKSIAITNRYDHTTKEQRLETVNSLPWANRF